MLVCSEVLYSVIAGIAGIEGIEGIGAISIIKTSDHLYNSHGLHITNKIIY